MVRISRLVQYSWAISGVTLETIILLAILNRLDGYGRNKARLCSGGQVKSCLMFFAEMIPKDGTKIDRIV